MPLLDALQVPTYAKYFKDILANKREMPCECVKPTTECSAAIMDVPLQKMADPGCPTIPCSIGVLNIDKALCDLGASYPEARERWKLEEAGRARVGRAIPPKSADPGTPAVNTRYQASPRTSHRQAVKRIFRYLKFTPELGLWYSSGSSLFLRGFSDADHAGCRIDRKSTSGTCQLLGTSLVSWSSRKQASVSLSRVHSCCSLLLWMKATLSDFGLRFGKIPLLVDSTSAISIAKNPVLHSRTKHIDVRFHFLRDHYEKGDIDLVHVASENQLANIFTKPLEFGAFVRLR
ncbi:hypothetical protein U9M48_027961, partial [Paspalum notatum var. saurae]